MKTRMSWFDMVRFVRYKINLSITFKTFEDNLPGGLVGACTLQYHLLLLLIFLGSVRFEKPGIPDLHPLFLVPQLRQVPSFLIISRLPQILLYRF